MDGEHLENDTRYFELPDSTPFVTGCEEKGRSPTRKPGSEFSIFPVPQLLSHTNTHLILRLPVRIGAGEQKPLIHGRVKSAAQSYEFFGSLFTLLAVSKELYPLQAGCDGSCL
jgi:hypothetical protein